LLEVGVVLEGDPGAELAAGVEEELSAAELDFVPPSAEEADDESLLPSLDPELAAPSDFGAADDFDG